MIRYPSPLVETRKDHALVSQEPQSQCTNSALPTATSQLGYSASEAWTHQRIHREIRTPFTCPSRNLSSGYSSSKAWTHQRIHCRYSIREPISTWRVWIFCWSSMDSPTHSQRNPNTLHMPISKSVIRIF